MRASLKMGFPTARAKLPTMKGRWNREVGLKGLINLWYNNDDLRITSRKYQLLFLWFIISYLLFLFPWTKGTEWELLICIFCIIHYFPKLSMLSPPTGELPKLCWVIDTRRLEKSLWNIASFAVILEQKCWSPTTPALRHSNLGGESISKVLFV